MRKIHWLTVAIMILFSGCGISEKLQNVGITKKEELQAWQKAGFTVENLKLKEDEVEDIIIGYKKQGIEPKLARKFSHYSFMLPSNYYLPERYELYNLHSRQPITISKTKTL